MANSVLEILQTITPYFGFITSVLFYICPISLIYLLHNKMVTIQNSSCLGIIASLINCTLWFTWGLASYVVGSKIKFEPLDFCNLIGAILSLIYLTIYCYHYTKGFNWYLLFYLFSLYDITFEIAYFEIELLQGESKLYDLKNTIISWIASVFNIIMYITPGINMIKVFKTRNHQMISILGSILGAINSFTWLLWGCVCMNKHFHLLHVVVANTIGLGLCISQVVVYYYYKKKNEFGISVYKSDVNVNDNNKSRKTSVDSLSKNQNNPAIFEF